MSDQASLRVLHSIDGSLKNLVRVLTAMNENLVKFADMSRKAEVHEMPESSVSDKYIKDLGERIEGYAGGAPTLGEALRAPYKKAGE